jgi:hypothetical protein
MDKIVLGDQNKQVLYELTKGRPEEPIMVVLMKLHTNCTLSFVDIGNNGIRRIKSFLFLWLYSKHLPIDGGLLPSTSCNSSMMLKDMNPWSHLYACNSEFKLSEAEKLRRI